MVYDWINTILDRLYPPSCLLCGAPGQQGRDLCSACQADLPHNNHACRRCALPLASGTPDATLCGNCQTSPPRFDACLAPLRYQEPVDQLVGRFKFGGDLTCGRLLAGLLGDHLEAGGAAMPELILPVPLHPLRLRQRGFNQALEIARPLARRFAIPLAPRACIRTRDTHPQSQLDQKRRVANLRQAFALRQPLPAGHLAIVDDVVTTGSTVDSLARLLKQQGARRVDVWALARTPEPHTPGPAAPTAADA